MSKKLCISLAIFILTLASSMTAFAAPDGGVFAAKADGITWISEQVYTTPVNAQPMPDGNWFDPVYYSMANPDVVAAFGTDTAALYAHYVNCGEAEGRLALDPAGYDYVHIICDGREDRRLLRILDYYI